MSETAVPQERRKTLCFLNLLRAAAIGMVVWDHLGPYRQPDWRLGQLVENTFNRPLGVIQSFGALGVSLFFLISGFLVVYSTAAGTEKPVGFLARRLGRLLPPLWVSFFSFYLVQWVVGFCQGQPTYWSQFSGRQWVLGGTLVGYFLGQPDVINGTTWYLVPTILFYLFCALLLFLLPSHPVLFLGGIEGITAVGLLAAALVPNLSKAVYGTLSFFWYLPMLTAGALLCLVWMGKVRPLPALLLGGVDYLLLLKGVVLFQPQYYQEQPYLISFVYGVLLFALALLLEEKLPIWPVCNLIAKTSYSIYLTHMTYGSLLLTLWTPELGFTLAFLLTLLTVEGIALLHYKLVEQPVGQWIKHLATHS